jgi:hypothetical protein
MTRAQVAVVVVAAGLALAACGKSNNDGGGNDLAMNVGADGGLSIKHINEPTIHA